MPNRTVTVPASNALVGTTDAQTLTNKTIAAGSNTISGISEAMLSTTDVATGNVSTSKHGFAPKAPNDATKFLDGTGAWGTPAGAVSLAAVRADAIRADLREWIGGNYDETGLTDYAAEIQDALDDLVTLKTRAVLATPAGRLAVGTTLTHWEGIYIEGQGSGHGVSTPGSALVATSGLNGPILRGSSFGGADNAYQHHSGVRMLRFDHNAAIGGNALEYGAVGENFLLDLVLVSGAYANAIAFYRSTSTPSTPLHLGRLSLHSSGRGDSLGGGLYLDNQNLTSVDLQWLGGDNNAGGLLWVKSFSDDGAITLHNFKAERWAGYTGQPYFIVFEDGNGGVLTIMNGRIHTVTAYSGAEAQTAIVKLKKNGANAIGRVNLPNGLAWDDSDANLPGYVIHSDDTTIQPNIALTSAERRVSRYGIPVKSEVGFIASQTWETGVATKGSAYTATTADRVINCTPGSSAMTITLYTAVGNTGRRIRIARNDASSGLITIDGNGSETINGALTITLNGRYEFVELISDGANWHIAARSLLAFSAKSANYTTVNPDEILTVDASGGARTITLLSAINAGAGKRYTVKKIDATNNVIVATTSSQTIDGATTKTLTTQYAAITVVSDGANWQIVNQMGTIT